MSYSCCESGESYDLFYGVRMRKNTSKFEENRDVDIVRSIFGHLRKNYHGTNISHEIMTVNKKILFTKCMVFIKVILKY